MKDLFVLDMKDYDPDGEVVTRPSTRGIILKGDKVLLIHSRKYDYYKFPGGGIEKGENPIEALIREVQEETGYVVIPSTIREYGRVLRRQRDSYTQNGIFEQENFYYFCEIEEAQREIKLDAYEAEEGFEAVWMEPFQASRHNSWVEDNGADLILVRREEKVLRILDSNLRQLQRENHERETIQNLGDVDYADMLQYVESVLGEECCESTDAKISINYSRFRHIKRVLKWAIRLYEASSDKEQLSKEDIMIATIFHDVGKIEAQKKNIPHALAGVPLTREYLLNHGFSKERTDYICWLVEHHSDKDTMTNEDVDKNLLVLMEADLLDDIGALGVVMDCMITEARDSHATFADCLDHMQRFTQRIHRNNPLVTLEGRRIWDEKTRIVNEFIDSLKEDVEL